MSGIYIPGMEMPEACIWCPIFNGEWGLCQATQKNVLNAGGRKDCPLIPVPEHGDLIDRGVLCEKLEKAVKIKPDLNGMNAAISFAFLAPTIIPADKEAE